ncbi:f-box domain cyclin-like protein [Diplodia corticola]|uniref:F-box domain cyclin-like protein n=1 Tax=Diplodia corticola TaxID=236234 RepID=A0A1J9R6Z1_9PEZI|nr:f-box domain cyclin-like protein [Diplodia corticola]OJD36368.1 f-box domain cyclin-like protein [Diplodia corticola]
MPATLEDLADELLLDILDYISVRNRWDIDFKTWAGGAEIESRVRTLHSVALVSRRLYRVANQVLYSALVDGADATRRRQFLRTAVKRPDLAAMVKEVRFSYFDWHGTLNRSGVPAEYTEVLEAAKRVDIDGDERERASFQKALLESFNDADVALLFSQLPSLETLEFEVDETWFHTWKWFLCLARRAVENKSGPLASLRHLRPKYGNENASGFHPLFIQDFVGLPSLKTIEMSAVWLDERDGDRPLSLQTNSRIETLAFWDSLPGNAFVECALNAFVQLKAFRYTYGNFLAAFIPYAQMQDFYNALHTRKDTLEHFSLLVSDRCTAFRQIARRSFIVPRFGSFKAFAKLRHLEISEPIISGLADMLDNDFGADAPVPAPAPDHSELVDILPASLESMVIQCDFSVSTEPLTALKAQFLLALARRVTSLPRFRRLELLRVGDIPRLGDFEEALGRIRDLAECSGVEFDIVRWDKAKYGGLSTA